MTHELSIDEYIARQPAYDKRRRILHPLLRAALPAFCKIEAEGVDNIALCANDPEGARELIEEFAREVIKPTTG